MRHRSAVPLLATLGFSTLAGLASVPARAAIGWVGTTFPLRRGVSEFSDLISPYPRLGKPVCFQMGTALSARLITSDTSVTRWKITDAKLTRRATGEVLWQVSNPGTAGTVTRATLWPLPALPSWIDHCTLTIKHLTRRRDGTTQWHAAQSSEVFLVLDAPKPPQSPAWTPVLRHACSWAAGATTAEEAAVRLTEGLYARGTYNGGYWAYTSSSSDSGETFHLRDFLLDRRNLPSRFPYGQCNDFADFLVCLHTAVGGFNIYAQRSNSYWSPGFYFNTLDPAGSLGPTTGGWNYHQFGIVGTAVWDSAAAIVGYGLPQGWERDTTYKPRLVNRYFSGGAWTPTPASGFLPRVTTDPGPY